MTGHMPVGYRFICGWNECKCYEAKYEWAGHSPAVITHFPCVIGWLCNCVYLQAIHSNVNNSLLSKTPSEISKGCRTRW